MLWISIFLALFIVWTIVNLTFLPKLNGGFSSDKQPLISVLVPMRNEERNVNNCIQMLKNLSYENLEIIIYEDQSTDQTFPLLQQAIGQDTRFQILPGIPLKKGWVGKVHACHQLRQHAKGDYLCFVDADVTLHPDVLSYSLERAIHKQAALITGFPKFSYTNWLDQLVIPMMHFIVYVHLPIALANFTKVPTTSAANGTFMFFKTDSYDQIGGHQAVKQSLIEDIQIARTMKKNGHRVLLANVTDYVSCKMYETSKETWEGFSKNMFAGIGQSIPLAMGITAFYAFFYVMPLLYLVYGIISWDPLFMVPYALTVVHRAICDRKSKTPLYYSFFVPLSSVLLLVILWRSVYLSGNGKAYTWKGRSYE